MAGKIVFLADFDEDDNGVQRVSALFFYELTPGEQRQVNGILVVPNTSIGLTTQFPEIGAYGMISNADMIAIDAGTMVFELDSVTRHPEDPPTGIDDKLAAIYPAKRAAYMAQYNKRWFVAGKVLTT